MYRHIPLQTKLFPCNGKYSDKEVSDLERSWAQVIKEKLLPFLAKIENEFAQFFSKTMGRPVKYIALLIVLHIFKEMNDYTDEELIETARFDKRFEFAFELPYEELTICQKTLHNFRELVRKNKLARTIFERGVEYISKLFNIDTSEQRLDSTHITSNMAKLSRLGLFVRVTENFLHKLKKVDQKSYDALPGRFQERYGKRRGYFADARSKKVTHRLGECAEDIWYLINRFQDNEQIASLKVMVHLKRVFDEHCEIGKPNNDNPTIVKVLDEENENQLKTIPSAADKQAEISLEKSSPPSEQVESGKNQVIVKPSKEIPSGALQNPSDEDSAYGYKGQGFEVAIGETCSPQNPFQIIADTQIDPANHSDQNTTLEYVERTDKNGMKPKVLHTDGNFVSGENIVKCAEKGVDLQGILTGSDNCPEKLKLADFKFAEDGITVTACPAGHQPTAQNQEHAHKSELDKSTQSFLVHFDLEKCQKCPFQNICPVTLQKKAAVLRFSRAELASSKRRREQESQDFKERNKIRAGIEATNSELKKRQGLGHLRVRGQPRVAFTVFFKTLACNVKRMVNYVQSLPISAPEPEKSVEMGTSLA